MKLRDTLRALIVLAFLSIAPALPAVELVPMFVGLSSPLFVGNAGDGSNRLFIVEQTGAIKVVQPGAATPTVFLDISSRVLAGGEQGLLGLAFHPQYRTNRRFFVYYTDPTFEIVIAEYRVSAADPNVADLTERVLLTIPHPDYGNHNGGMLTFGPDGYLYAGTGDGGAGNDPFNNAQNLDSLLGKILRIDVDTPSTSGAPYVSPPTNPFYGATAGRDEIFAYGMRNPWRFSFDRGGNRAMWVGDVGQDNHEEVDTPIVSGGNYGWRVYEGFTCTDNDPTLCNPNNYRFPILDYTHSNGRCSITGGYVYRGPSGALPDGTYVYSDYCTGEIFAWDGSTQRLLLATSANVSSFGEDEAGEVYVVDINGRVLKFAPDGALGTAIEYYYADWDYYFVTAFPDEIALLDSGGFGGNWHRTGQSFGVWMQPAAGTVPTCRFFSTSFAPKSSHFYTPYAAECTTVKANPDWQYESIAFYLQLPDANGLCPLGMTTLYRLYNDGMGGAPNHRYTTDNASFFQMLALGWLFEGNGQTGAFACVR